MSELGIVLRERYELVAVIGKGGTSTVYLAKDRSLDCYWAVKVMDKAQATALDAFKKEVELLSTLSHPDIPRIVDRIEVEGKYYVVMDFVDGTSLEKRVRAEGAQNEKDIVEWAKMLCDVLDYLHNVRQNPIIYRDMKPGNVMLTKAGRTTLIDFGIAIECAPGQCAPGESVGTKGYAAPEQYTGASNLLDERTDIYSLGATMYYLASGVTPRRPPRGVGSARRYNAAISEELDYIIAKCTHDDPARRYQNCSDLKADLINIHQLTSSYRSRMRAKLLPFVACCLAAVFFFATAVGGYIGIRADNVDRFRVAFTAATAYERDGEYALAAQSYTEAISYAPGDYETYLLLFNVLLPRAGDDDFITKTKLAIDEMRKLYIENTQSPMHHEPRLMFQVAKKCLEVEDSDYAVTAFDYIQIIKQTSSYKKGQLVLRDIDSYEVLASYLSKDAQAQDFSRFNEALLTLENSADTELLTPDERLDNYYTAIKMYYTYPMQLQNAYIRIYEIGGKAKAVFDEHAASGDIRFSAIEQLYQLVASAQYSQAAIYTDDEDKINAYTRCIEWFGYLAEMGALLPESSLLKYGNANMALFTLLQNRLPPEQALVYIERALALFTDAVAQNPDSFSANICLTQGYIERELVKPPPQRNFAPALQSYEKVAAIYAAMQEPTPTAVSQMAALKRQMQNAGLEVE